MGTVVRRHQMAALDEEGTLAVPGADLYFKIRGSSPMLLLIQGGGGDADGTPAIAGWVSRGRLAALAKALCPPSWVSKRPPPRDSAVPISSAPAVRTLVVTMCSMFGMAGWPWSRKYCASV